MVSTGKRGQDEARRTNKDKEEEEEEEKEWMEKAAVVERTE